MPEKETEPTPKQEMNMQRDCPLFSAIPAEIRNRIYEFSLESSSYGTGVTAPTRYKKRAMYYRPGFQSAKRINTALLQTCQLIHAEASLVPPAMNEHTFWCHRPPPHVKNPHSPDMYFRNMTPEQLAVVSDLHFFTQQFFLEGDGGWGRICASFPKIGITPRKLTITLRHSDWWFWERNEDLGIDPFRLGRVYRHQMGVPPPQPQKTAWGYGFRHLPSLEELEIEFETVMRKRDQLDAIITRALGWRFPLDNTNQRELVADPRSKRIAGWIGTREGLLQEQQDQDGNSDGSSAEDEEQDWSLTTHNTRGGRGRLRRWPRRSKKKAQSQKVDAQAEAEEPLSIPLFTPPPAGEAAAAGSNREFDPAKQEEYYIVWLTWRPQIVDTHDD